MSKFKNFIEEQKSDLKNLVYNYTLTIIAVALLSVVLCIDFEIDKTKDYIYNTEIFLGVFAVGALFIETFFVHKEQAKNWGRLAIFYVVNAALSAIWTILAHFSEDIAENFDYPDIYYLNISKILAVYIVGLLAVTLYKLVKNSGLKLDTYFARAIFGLLKMWGLFFVIYWALCLLLSIFDSLIMDIDYWDIMDNLTALLCGFVCFPYSLLMISDTKDENSKFTKGLINFALMPAVVIAFLIVYLYIIKIIVNWDMPSNEVFGICLKVFILGGPVWFISYGFLREKAEAKGEPIGIFGKIVKNMKYAYAPLIILEMVSIGIRMASYGLTTERYLAIVAIVFQLIYVLWDVIGRLFKRELKEEGLILVGLGIFAFVLLCPVLNMNKLPAEVQIARFEDALDEEDYMAAAGAYDYLRFDEHGDKYLDEELTVETRDDLELIFYDYVEKNDEYKYEEYVYVKVPNVSKENDGIVIEGYTHFYEFNFDGYYDKVYKNEVLKAFTISYGENYVVTNVDITPIIDKAIEIYKDSDNSSNVMDYQYIKLGDNCCIVVEKIYFRYNTYIKEIKGLDLEGYVLINEGAHNGQ